MSEFQLAPYTVINGRPVDGRSVQREDGSYISYDLGDAKLGDTLNVVNEKGGLYELVKTDENGGVLEGWLQYEHTPVGPDKNGPERLERSLGRAVRIAVLLRNPYGAPILTSTHVVREEHHEFGVVSVEPDDKEVAILRSLGVVARISSGQSLAEETMSFN